MKKFVLLFMLLFLGSTVNADTCVGYNIAGHPVNISHGAGPAISYSTY